MPFIVERHAPMVGGAWCCGGYCGLVLTAWGDGGRKQDDGVAYWGYYLGAAVACKEMDNWISTSERRRGKPKVVHCCYRLVCEHTKGDGCLAYG